jgi:hypothetical protein
MKCNDLHKKSIFFLEAELPPEEMRQIQLHLNECEKCSLYFENLKQVLGTIETDKIRSADPYFYTRLKARMENQEEKELSGQSGLVRILQPALFTILFLASIYGGYKIGGTEATYKSATIETQNIIPYLNEMKSESIESFLME